MHRHIETHHFIHRLNQDFCQCAVYVSDDPFACLIGVKYIISQCLFDAFPTDEQKLWHSHFYEFVPNMHSQTKITLDVLIFWYIKSALWITPGVPEMVILRFAVIVHEQSVFLCLCLLVVEVYDPYAMVLLLPFCGHSANHDDGVLRTYVMGETENLPPTTQTSVVVVAALSGVAFLWLPLPSQPNKKGREGRSKRLRYEAVPIHGGVAHVCYVLATKDAPPPQLLIDCVGASLEWVLAYLLSGAVLGGAAMVVATKGELSWNGALRSRSVRC
ncbi:hypothetical protein Cgig2_024209 [Carnegiea gigantea]|uniref:Uncharacterized protein n=1 Tax=Carnegiea gigantea TaxID=171969 RepID=A0A9Q1JK42_9CARY|nr:hypothetical protein Cgig2_024209 [Carnegiea gigantea]